MCGIAGFFGKIDSESQHILELMTQSISHRGPDAAGAWVDKESGIALGHRRLSIVELSDAGSQPMHSASDRFVIAFNGEIYNHMSLRKALDVGIAWRGHSDTETLLNCVDAWGLQKTLELCEGMFALALWDKEERSLVLARDRVGEKPLYYGNFAGGLIFGSELKAIRANPGFSPVVDPEVIPLFLRFSSIPAPFSIYEGIKKLPPGAYIKFRRDDALSNCVDIAPISYWDLNTVVSYGRENQFLGDEKDAVQALDKVLSRSVSQQMLSDVPLGAFLSGGIDSSTIAALMQKQSSKPIQTFTIGFDVEEFDEARQAQAVAKHLGTDHTELYLSAKDALDVVPKIPNVWCEPLGDSSQIPTLLVSEMARKSITVALSGDGADESFGGYSRHFYAPEIWGKTHWLPLAARAAISSGLSSVREETWDKCFDILKHVLPAKSIVSMPGTKLSKFVSVLGYEDRDSLLKMLVSRFQSPHHFVTTKSNLLTRFDRPSILDKSLSLSERMMMLDTLAYLPDVILAKVDRAAMAVSLETRAPFLDHNVIAFAWSLTPSMKTFSGTGKVLLRKLLTEYVPAEIVNKPKRGFDVPIGRWLRDDLGDWAESLLDESRLKRDGYFEPTRIRKIWSEHKSGTRDRSHCLWNILMFQAWLEHQK